MSLPGPGDLSDSLSQFDCLTYELPQCTLHEAALRNYLKIAAGSECAGTAIMGITYKSV